jgi:hypothetical protein
MVKLSVLGIQFIDLFKHEVKHMDQGFKGKEYQMTAFIPTRMILKQRLDSG